MSDFKNTEIAFKKFGANVIHRAKFYLKRRKINTKKSTLSDSLSFNVKVYPSGALEMDFSAVDYMPFVEEGRLPGKMPPPSAIAEWIKIKPIRLRDTKSGKFKSKTEANINSAAFAIAMHIKTYGIKPTWFFRDAFAMHRKRLAPELIKAYGTDSAKMLKNILGNEYTK
tara:strand:+ start:1495 stop:2001 length:507 start_codon:yes stop_codon:yes gene_type:complete